MMALLTTFNILSSIIPSPVREEMHHHYHLLNAKKNAAFKESWSA